MCAIKLLMHSQISTVAPLSLGIDKYFHRTPYNGCLIIHARIIVSQIQYKAPQVMAKILLLLIFVAWINLG